MSQEIDLNKKRIAYYPFENSMEDASGYQVPAVVPHPLSYVTGKAGKAVFLAGETFRFELPHNLIRLDLREKAISFWFNCTHIPLSGSYILDKTNKSDYFLKINGETKELIFGLENNESSQSVVVDKIKSEKWYHLLINRNADTFEIYLNNIKSAVILAKNIKTSPDWLIVGQAGTPFYNGFPFIGYLDEFMVFDRKLELCEMKKLATLDYKFVSTNFKENESFELPEIQFERDQFVLLSSAYKSLNTLGDYLLKNPDKKLKIIGHTDSKGSEGHNMELSLNRAKEVKKYLEKFYKIKSNRLTTKGMGGKQPIASNISEKEMQKNRRVEFVIY